MVAKANVTIETIGTKLREQWSDVVSSPLPEKLLTLLAALERRDQSAPLPAKQPQRPN
jgi:hypothetical protein